VPRNLNKKEPTKPIKNKFEKKANIYTRPKSTFKKYETEFRINETSLSTQASYLFRGIVEDYVIGKELGKGAYAIVKQALHKPTNKKFAVKIYEKSKLFDPQKSSSVKKEIQILKKIDHPNIVKMHEVLETSKQVNS
jgi:serine/threonine protein kinase